jgi:signal transduction histidine kinase
MSSPSLQQRIVLGLLGYMLLLGVVIIGFGFSIHEAAERHAWQAILRTELDEHLRRSREDADYRWSDTETLTLRISALDDTSSTFAALPEGLHDEVHHQGRQHVVLVRIEGRQHMALSLDITDFEARERGLLVLVLSLAAGLGVVLALGATWLVRRLADPLRQLAAAIATLQPDSACARLPLQPDASRELAVIVSALNGFLDRSDAFVQRERAFVQSASHELRTPVAVIAGAVDLALGQPQLAAETRSQLQRIRRAAGNVERLLPLLLALAKSPERLLQAADRFKLDALLPEIVDDHRHLLGDKALQIDLAPLPGCRLAAPLNIVQAAIGNLLRNAIESSDSGTIRMALSATGVVSIEDPGQRMTPEQISALYARHARGQAHDGGIGLELVARLCEHLGWRLSFEARASGGTRTTLDLGGSLAR